MAILATPQGLPGGSGVSAAPKRYRHRRQNRPRWRRLIPALTVEFVGAIDLAAYAVGHAGPDELGFGEVVSR